MTYKQARADFEYLETKAKTQEWAWVEERFQDFLENPTKKYAEDIYVSLIDQWFNERDREGNNIGNVHAIPFAENIDARVFKIAERYGCTFVKQEQP